MFSLKNKIIEMATMISLLQCIEYPGIPVKAAVKVIILCPSGKDCK